MKYKPGDKVRIKSLDWYNENKDKDGRVYCNYTGFCKEMREYCGKELTIDFIYGDDGKLLYVMKEPKINWGFTDDMIEDSVDAEPQEKMVSLEKACKWLENINIDDYMDSGIFQMYDMIQDFRRVME